MFTGIIEATGRVIETTDRLLVIDSSLDGLAVGDSVAVNGVCLTVVEKEGSKFKTDLSEETTSRSNLGSITRGDEVNLELPMVAGDRFGGHVVQGHVDSVGTVTAIERLEASVLMRVEVPGTISRYIVEKGSVTVDGVSLTAAKVSDKEFSVALIPHTLDATNLRLRRPGDAVNIEVDILAKYVERLLDKGETQ